MQPHDTTLDIPYGYCHCGCGQKTTIYRGEPRRFIHGHHTRFRRTPPLAEHFWTQVKIRGTDECWEWQGYKSRKGYGQIQINHQVIATHRVAWELTHGPIPDDLQVLHKCDNPPCCNPNHLFLGTNADNVADKIAKKRHPIGTKIGLAKLTEEQVIEARQRFDKGGISIAALAREYGVSGVSMRSALLRLTWKHVP